VRHNLQGGEDQPVTAFDVESAIIDILEISRNGAPLNDIAGHGNLTRGIRSPEDIARLAFASINPNQPYTTVFAFPITKALSQGNNPYDATRRTWAVSRMLRDAPNSVAVGISDSISRGIFTIDNWAQVGSKWEFTGSDISAESPLFQKNWNFVINAAMGYWQWGQYLVVEFDGEGRFRFKRGNANDDWQALSIA
jgi:hypothetical protein